jgi:hypothetical protein
MRRRWKCGIALLFIFPYSSGLQAIGQRDAPALESKLSFKNRTAGYDTAVLVLKITNRSSRTLKIADTATPGRGLRAVETGSRRRLDPIEYPTNTPAMLEPDFVELAKGATICLEVKWSRLFKRSLSTFTSGVKIVYDPRPFTTSSDPALNCWTISRPLKVSVSPSKVGPGK